MGPARALAATTLLLACLALRAQTAAAQPPLTLDPTVPPAVVPTGPSVDDRVTIPIMIDGKGPWNFIVDTGAQRTVIARDLAQRLALPAGAPVTVVSMAGRLNVDTMALTRMTVGRDMIEDIQAPVLEGDHLGAPGLLGLDGLHEKRLLLDFRARHIEITSSTLPIARDPDAIVVRAKRRKGQLILMHSDADGVPVSIILDTGSAISVGNDALMRRLKARGSLTINSPASLTSVTGGLLNGPTGQIGAVQIGPVALRGVPVLFGQATVFDQLGLRNRPALMLGVDALRSFDRVAIDFGRGKVDLLPPDTGARDTAPRFAAAEAQPAGN